ncbi:nucleoside triphosphate pyrophosphohydrolase [bacterium]|nr:nucleoside triphosphate pyrophosphohydrolase [bacterium]
MLSKFEKLVNIISELRGENGCPWDKEQDHQSMKPYLIEEVYEALEMIENNDYDGLKEELGDILLHVIFHAQMAKEKGEFSIEDVIDSITNKLIQRHPHVFGETEVSGSKQVLKNWEKLKLKEREEKGNEASLLDGVPTSMPALLVAQRIQDKASRVGFDWDNWKQVFEKIREELKELENSLIENDRVQQEEELGDLLFAVTNLGRFIDISSEMVLRKAVEKFKRRFLEIERVLRDKGGVEKASLSEMDAIWDAVKEKE